MKRLVREMEWEGGQIQNARNISVSMCSIFRTKWLHAVCSHRHRKRDHPSLLSRTLLGCRRPKFSSVLWLGQRPTPASLKLGERLGFLGAAQMLGWNRPLNSSCLLLRFRSDVRQKAEKTDLFVQLTHYLHRSKEHLLQILQSVSTGVMKALFSCWNYLTLLNFHYESCEWRQWTYMVVTAIRDMRDSGVTPALNQNRRWTWVWVFQIQSENLSPSDYTRLWLPFLLIFVVARHFPNKLLFPCQLPFSYHSASENFLAALLSCKLVKGSVRLLLSSSPEAWEKFVLDFFHQPLLIHEEVKKLSQKPSARYTLAYQ